MWLIDYPIDFSLNIGIDFLPYLYKEIRSLLEMGLNRLDTDELLIPGFYYTGQVVRK